VASGLWIVRAGRYGDLTVSDPTGRVVAEADATAHPDAVVVAEVSTATAPTPYARAGNWFAWLCAATVLALLAAAVRHRAGNRWNTAVMVGSTPRR
jgi:apolipoprotein N-acyltransferase